MKTKAVFKKLLQAGIKQLLTILFILSVFSYKANASDYYWIGGTGNWDELAHWATSPGGTVLYTEIPTALDDVHFDANSFTAAGQIVHFNPQTIFVHNMNWTGVTNNPTMAAPASNLLKIYGSLVFAPGMNMSFLGNINFEATTAGQILVTAGKTFNSNLFFNGMGGVWTLQDDIIVSGALLLYGGTLNTNDRSVIIKLFNSDPGNSTPRTLNMGASVFTLTTDLGWEIDGPGFMANGGTSVVNMPAGTFNGGGANYNDVNFTDATSTSHGTTGNGNFHDVVFASKGTTVLGNYHNVIFNGDGVLGGNFFNDLTLTPGHSYSLWDGSVTTISGTFHANGSCGALIDIHSSVVGMQATISHSAGTVALSYLVLKDINTTGGATFTASNSSNLGNNTGWIFTSTGAQTLYWIGNSGNWSDGNHWSNTSGGVPSGCSPTPADNVFFDANSFSSSFQAVTIDPLIAYCRNMVWTGVTNNPAMTGQGSKTIKIYGSLTFSPNMNLGFQGQVNFEATNAGHTITMAGKSFNGQVNVNGIGGGWTLQDDFAGGAFVLNAGTFTSNNKMVNIGAFQSISATTATLNMGTSIFNTAGWNAATAPLVINCGTSVINSSGGLFSGGSHNYYDVNFAGPGDIEGNNHFHDVVFGSGAAVSGLNSFHNAIFNGDGAIYSADFNDLTLTAGHSYSIGGILISGAFHANGNCGAYLDIHSFAAGSQASISKNAGVVNASYLILKDIYAGGGATFNAGNSTDLGNVSGWIINPAAGQDLYWVGNGGNWSDGNHWSHTSGGAASGCSPTPLDNVFFDANSFSYAGQNVLMDPGTAYCRNMIWTGVANDPSLSGFGQLKIYGSLAFSPNMSTPFNGLIYFEATSPGQTITTAGQSFHSAVIINGIGGSWTFLDAFTSIGSLSFNQGILNTNDQIVNVGSFNTAASGSCTLNLGASVFNTAGWAVADLTSININSGTSVINFSGSGFFAGTNHVYYDVNFTNTSAAFGSIQGNFNAGVNHFHNVVFATQQGNISTKCTFNSLTFLGDGQIQKDQTCNDLNFSAGHTYTLYANTTQTLNDHWHIQGSCTSYIVLETNVPGLFSSVIKPPGDVLGYNLHIKDIHCSGGANFIAYNSVDLGGNAGWNFSILPPLNNPNSIVGPVQICSGSSSAVVYHIPSVVGAISYQWTVPAGASIVSGQGDTTIVVNFGTATSGNIIVQSFNGCNVGTISSFLAVVVGTQPVPLLSIVADTLGPACPGAAVTFTVTASNTGGNSVNYDFQINGVSAQSGSSNVFVATALSNNDGVSCIATIAASGCLAASHAVSDTISINVNTDTPPDPHITIVADPAGQACAGIPITFTAVVTGSGSSSINYDFKVNGISVQNSSSNTFTSTSLSNNDAVSCEILLSATTCFAPATAVSNTITANVNTDPAPDPHISISASPAGQVCMNTAVTFTATTTGAGSGTVNYNFKINGISAQSSASNSYTVSTLSNNDAITCELTVSATACFTAATAASNTIIISVNTDPAPDPHISVTASPLGQICLNTAVTFTATVTGAGNSSVNYDFKINGISVQSSSSNTFTITTLLNNDQVTCNATTIATACFAATTVVSDMILMNVNTDAAPDPHVSMTAGPVGQICAGLPITFKATATGTGANLFDYDFNVNGNSVQHGSSNIFTTGTLMNNDAITCIISVNGGTCFSSTNAMSNVIVLDGRGCDDCELKIPNAITPNGDGINDKWIISNQNCFRQLNVLVYNRYGSLVYQKENYQNDWMGTYKSNSLPDATYYYIIKAIKRDGREQVLKGNVTILR